MMRTLLTGVNQISDSVSGNSFVLDDEIHAAYLVLIGTKTFGGASKGQV